MFFKRKKQDEKEENVINYARNIDLVEIIISSDFKQEIEKIKNLYKDSKIEMVNLEDFGKKMWCEVRYKEHTKKKEEGRNIVWSRLHN